MAMERRGRVIGSDDHANCAKQEEHDRMTKPALGEGISPGGSMMGAG
jgi:hypothetical protein